VLSTLMSAEEAGFLGHLGGCEVNREVSFMEGDMLAGIKYDFHCKQNCACVNKKTLASVRVADVKDVLVLVNTALIAYERLR